MINKSNKRIYMLTMKVNNAELEVVIDLLISVFDCSLLYLFFFVVILVFKFKYS